MLDHSELPHSDVLTGAALQAHKGAAIDHPHLRRFTMGDLQLEHEVLALFACELQRTLANLQAATTMKEWKIAAHTLKGSARTVGAWQVAAAAVDAERDPNVVEDRAGKADIIAACERAVFEAVTYISGLQAPDKPARNLARNSVTRA